MIEGWDLDWISYVIGAVVGFFAAFIVVEVLDRREASRRESRTRRPDHRRPI